MSDDEARGNEHEVCSSCGGTGWDDGAEDVCFSCNGIGCSSCG